MTYRESSRQRIGRRVLCKALLSIGLLAVVSLVSGCKRPSSAKADDPGGIAADQMVSPGEVIGAYRSCLAVVQTTWEEKSSLVGRWKRRGDRWRCF